MQMVTVTVMMMIVMMIAMIITMMMMMMMVVMMLMMKIVDLENMSRTTKLHRVLALPTVNLNMKYESQDIKTPDCRAITTVIRTDVNCKSLYL